MVLTEKQKQRFLNKIDKKGENDCWCWIGSTTSRGYGDVAINGKVYLSHRVSYAIHKNDPNPKLKIMHSCDNPKCCNPKHLIEGTDAQNTHDMMQKGRAKYKVLTIEQVREIRLLYPGLKQREIASLYGVTQREVSHIVTGGRWGSFL